ncbi:MAG: conjugal transfer protein TraF [Pseudomonadota bacterium]
MSFHRLTLALASGVLFSTASAAPFAPFDPRAAGMGGTGVASAKTASAALFNPAMLSAQVEGDRFQIALGLGAQAADEDEMVDQIDSLQITLDELDRLIATIDTSNIFVNTSNADLARVGDQATTLSGQFTQINGDNANLIPAAGLALGIASKKIGVGVFASLNGQLSISTTVDRYDTDRLNLLGTILEDGIVDSVEINNSSVADANGVPQPLFNTASQTVVDFSDFDSASSATAVGVAIAEVGVALSQQYTLANGGLLSAGVTPKSVDVITYEYTANTESFEDANIEDFEATDSGFDLDIGAVYKTSADAPWQFGAVAKNLIGGNYKTIAGRKIDVDMQLRAGVARMTKRTTLAVDLDLTENTGTTGTDATQFLAFGAEYDLKFLQLRAGYRANLAGGDVADVMTAGLGLGPVDLTAVVSDNTLGAYLNLGFGW